MVSALPVSLKMMTGFLFTKSWCYRRCVTPFAFLACGFSALPGGLLLKKGPPEELVALIQSQQSAKGSLADPEAPLLEKQAPLPSTIAQLR